MFSAAKLPKKAKSRLSAANFFPRDQRRPGRQRCGAGRQWLWRGRLQRPGFGGSVFAARFWRLGFCSPVLAAWFRDDTGSGGDAGFRRHRPCPGSTFARNHTRVRPGAAVGAGSVSCRGQKRSTPGISRGACVPAAVGSSELPAQRVPWCLIWRPACCSVRRRCAAAWRQRASQRPCIRQRPSSSPYRQPGSL